MIGTKTIEELMEILNYKDSRAVRNWCEKHNVFINRQGQTEFVYEIEFELAFYKPFIQHLKKIHGDDWEYIYTLYKNGDLKSLEVLNTLPMEHQFYRKFKGAGEITNSYQKKYDEQSKTSKKG